MANRTRRPLLDRFEEKYYPEPNSGCWLWIGGGNKAGYGCIERGGWHGGKELAHRASYELFVGPIPAGAQVLHKCDTPCCVNPDHLTVGSQNDNMQDMIDKRRHRKSKQGHPLGVYKLPDYVKCSRPYYARVKIEGYGRSSKYFATQEEAHQAYLVLRQEAVSARARDLAAKELAP